MALTNEQEAIAEAIAEQADGDGTIQADGMLKLSMSGYIANDPTLHTCTSLVRALELAGLPDSTVDELWA